MKDNLEKKTNTAKRTIKKCTALLLSVTLAFACPISSKAYTEEQKAAAKAWLSSHGYSPDMGGAQQAYQDYLNGKFSGEVSGSDIPEGTEVPDGYEIPDENKGSSEVSGNAGDTSEDVFDDEGVVVDETEDEVAIKIQKPDTNTSTNTAESSSEEGSSQRNSVDSNAVNGEDGTSAKQDTPFSKLIQNNPLIVSNEVKEKQGRVAWKKIQNCNWSYLVTQSLWGASKDEFQEYIGKNNLLIKEYELDEYVLYSYTQDSYSSIYYFLFSKTQGLKAIQYTVFCQDEKETDQMREEAKETVIKEIKGKSEQYYGMNINIGKTPLLRSFEPILRQKYTSKKLFNFFISR